MKIVFEDSFLLKLQRQADYISNDKPQAAKKFKIAVIKECESLISNPYRCRKSIHFNDENIRDLIFKGYTIIYKISDDTISIFALTKHQEHGSEQ